MPESGLKTGSFYNLIVGLTIFPERIGKIGRVFAKNLAIAGYGIVDLAPDFSLRLSAQAGVAVWMYAYCYKITAGKLNEISSFRELRVSSGKNSGGDKYRKGDIVLQQKGESFLKS